MKRTITTKLKVRRETLRTLGSQELIQVAGGDTELASCPLAKFATQNAPCVTSSQ